MTTKEKFDLAHKRFDLLFSRLKKALKACIKQHERLIRLQKRWLEEQELPFCRQTRNG